MRNLLIVFLLAAFFYVVLKGKGITAQGIVKQAGSKLTSGSTTVISTTTTQQAPPLAQVVEQVVAAINDPIIDVAINRPTNANPIIIKGPFIDQPPIIPPVAVLPPVPVVPVIVDEERIVHRYAADDSVHGTDRQYLGYNPKTRRYGAFLTNMKG